jgi:hypothetical protein
LQPIPRPAQFDLALTRPRPAAKPINAAARSLQAAGHVLATRGWRLCRLIERIQATIANIEVELRSRGAFINGPPQRYQRTLPFRPNELPRPCLNILRANGRPTHVREIIARVLRDKGLNLLDRALADAAVHPARDCLLRLWQEGVMRLIGALHSKGSRVELVDR